MNNIHYDLFRIYLRNHYFILPYLLFPLALIMAAHIFLYGTPDQHESIVIIPVMALAAFSFCAQVRIQKWMLFPVKTGQVRKKPVRERPVLAVLVLFKILTLCSCLFLLFNIVRLGSFNDLLLGYIVCSFLLIIYSSISSVFFPMFVMEVVTVTGFSVMCALLNLQYHENHYIPFIMILIAAMSLIIGIRNGKISRMFLTQKVQLQEAVKVADAAQKAKSDFIATLSHEIRTPLNGIMGMIQFLRDATLPPEQKESVDVIYNCSHTLLNTINDVLDLSKMEAGKFSIDKINFDIHHLLKSIHKLMAVRAREKNLQLELVIGEGVDKYIYGDPHRIQQVLMNLVSNAIKFTAQGGVTIRVSHKKGPKPFLVFEIIDTGAGMAPETKNKLFQDYVQADSSISRRFGGTGLGLSIAKRLVTLMEGTIGVISDVGKGSTFRFDIPYTPAEVSDVAVAEADSRAVNSRGVRILVAEDNPINQVIISKFLQKYDFSFDMAHDGLQAISMAKAEPYDMIFMDMQMPGMNGPEATRLIRALDGHYARVPVIGLTGNVLAEHIEECRKAGMIDHISKPIDFNLLLKKMIQHLPRLGEQPSSGKVQAGGFLAELTSLMGEEYVVQFTAEAYKNLAMLLGSAYSACYSNQRNEVQRYIHDVKSISGSIDRKDIYVIAVEIEKMAAGEDEVAHDLAEQILKLQNMLAPDHSIH